MKVILLSEVKKLGKEGDVVEVSEGYARNFLFKQNFAIQADPAALSQLSQKKSSAEKRVKREAKAMKKIAQMLEGEHVVIQEKTNEQGTLFAAVDESRIGKALRKYSRNIQDSWIEMDAPIKEIGEHRIRVNIPNGFEAELELTIESKSD